MGKSSSAKKRGKRRKKMQREHQQHHDLSRQMSSLDQASMPELSSLSSSTKDPLQRQSDNGSSKRDHDVNGGKTKKENGTMGESQAESSTKSPHTNTENVEAESRKRSRRKLEFVYPKQNGGPAPYLFDRQRKDLNKNNSDGKNSNAGSSEAPNGIQPSYKSAKDHTESIDDILFSSHGKRQRKLSFEMLKKEAEMSRGQETITEHQPTSRLEEHGGNEGRLSGLSVEEAVRDKSGCRPRANSTDGELNLPRRGLCDERTVLQAHKWNSHNQFRKTPKGLLNLGNTCFLNSTVQCLAFLPPFCQSLLAMPDGHKNNGNKVSQGKRITMMLRSLFQTIHGRKVKEVSGTGALAPRGLVQMLPTIGTCGSRNGYRFRIGRQEDAHEFLVHLLDAMHDGELREAGINQHASGWRDRLPVPRLDETTIIHRIFGGYLRSQVRCTKCGYCSNTYDPFLDLALEVSRKSINSVAAAFQEFTRKETLDSENRWKCSGCNKRVCATKQLTVFRPPLSLCVQLKRFSFGGLFGGGKGFKYGGFGNKGFGMRRGGKISKPIEFPSEMKLPLSDGRSCEYHLTGMVIHVGGSSDSGHYTAFVKKPAEVGKSQWYHIDDGYVESVSERTVLQERDAYLLFYCRKEVKLEFPAPPRPISASAEEAAAHGRARARARADSLTLDEDQSRGKNSFSTATVMKDATLSTQESVDSAFKDQATARVNGGSFQVAPTEKFSDVKQSELNRIGKSVADRETLLAPESSTGFNGSSSSDKNSATGSGDKMKALQEGHSEKSTKKQDFIPSERNSSDGHELEPKRKHSKTSDSSGNDSDSSSGDSDSSSSTNLPLPRTNSNTPLLNSSGANLVSQDSQSEPKSNAKDSTSQPKKKKDSLPTRVVMDRGRGREKVSVMLGPRHKAGKAWKPQASGTTKRGQDYELLGNRSVDKWDDSATDGQSSNVSEARSQVVNEMEKKMRSRKRKGYLDRWDASLDRGRTKKVKQKQDKLHSDTGTEPAKNAFQRVLTGLKKIKHPRPKGFFGKQKNDKKPTHKSKR